MALHIWLYSFCANGDLKEIINCLNQAGINVNILNEDAASGPGIIILDSYTNEVCDFVHKVSNNGTERILALATNAAEFNDDNVWQLLDAGASDVLFWDEMSDPGSVISTRVMRWREIDNLAASSLVRNNLIGQSHVWRSVLRRIIEVACFTDAPVLFMGETGTGKELAARLVHTLDSQRKEHELVVLDCTTIVPELSGSELFGHERGAFTGAVAARDGAFTLADRGTLFLDEVGELPLSLQVQLLRVLQEHTYKRVGSNTWRESDFRLICATNRDLFSEQANGKFRRDLYYRIASWVIELPPLRERVDDIIPLVEHFLAQARSGEKPLNLDEKVRRYFLMRDYPGNVRDLKNLVFRIATRHVGKGSVTVGDIPSDERPDSDAELRSWCDAAVEQVVRRALAAGAELKHIGRTVEEITIQIVVDEEDGNLQRAARKLGVTDRTLQKWRARQRKFIQPAANGRIGS